MCDASVKLPFAVLCVFTCPAGLPCEFERCYHMKKSLPKPHHSLFCTRSLADNGAGSESVRTFPKFAANAYDCHSVTDFLRGAADATHKRQAVCPRDLVC